MNEFKPTEPEDLMVLCSMSRCMMYGEIELPSGRVISAPPKGKVWWAHHGKLTLMDEQEAIAKQGTDD